VSAAERPIDPDELIRSAASARAHAYCPYSRFAVGAAVLAGSGRIYAGANVENASYGLTICAERAAVFAAASAGERVLRAVALVTDTPQPVPPCGACRQVLAELAPDQDLEVISATVAGGRARWRLRELLPYSFTLVPPAPA
jgi:cytidine deaminase